MDVYLVEPSELDGMRITTHRLQCKNISTCSACLHVVLNAVQNINKLLVYSLVLDPMTMQGACGRMHEVIVFQEDVGGVL